MCDEVTWQLTHLSNLQDLNLASCWRLTDASLPALWTLTCLTSLDLSLTAVTCVPGKPPSASKLGLSMHEFPLQPDHCRSDEWVQCHLCQQIVGSL